MFLRKGAEVSNSCKDGGGFGVLIDSGTGSELPFFVALQGSADAPS